MPQFKKGTSGNIQGRPRGSKDRRYLQLHYWFDLLEKELAKQIHVIEHDRSGTLIREYDRPAVDPNKRAQLFLEAMKMLVGKMKALPTDPKDSKLNAEQALTLLNEAELKVVKPEGKTGG